MTIQTLFCMLLLAAFNMADYQVVQQPTPAPTTTATPSPVSVPTSPASATSAALFATSTALAATTEALLGSPTNGPTSQTPRQLPNSGGDDLPWGGLAGLVMLLLVAGAWLRHRSKSIHHQGTKASK